MIASEIRDAGDRLIEALRASNKKPVDAVDRKVVEAAVEKASEAAAVEAVGLMINLLVDVNRIAGAVERLALTQENRLIQMEESR